MTEGEQNRVPPSLWILSVSYILSVSCRFLRPLEEKVLFITKKDFFFPQHFISFAKNIVSLSWEVLPVEQSSQMNVSYHAYKDMIAFYRYALFITVYKYIPKSEEQVSFLHCFQLVDMIIITGFLLVKS